MTGSSSTGRVAAALATAMSLAGVAACALALTGCAPTGFSVFDADQTRDDRLPREIVETIEMGDFDLSTARRLGEHHGLRFYALQPSEGSGPCLAVADGTHSFVSCGATSGRLDVTTDSGVEARLVPEYEPAAEGWTAIGDNLRVRD